MKRETFDMLIRIFLPFLIFLGLLHTAFLTYEHFSGPTPPCTTGFQLINCETVLTSKYATFFGIPLALLGFLYYQALGIVYLFCSKHTIVLPRILWLMTGFGVLVSFSLLYVQFFILHALCPFCTFSGLVNLLLFPISFLWLGAAKPRHAPYHLPSTPIP